MKKLLLFFYLILLLSSVSAQTAETNIISYYAVNNSLDGQLMIDKMNKLRFFPVFAMHEKIDTVNVTIYYGSNIYSRDAISYNNNKYWEVLLPNFKLGEAIQRIEVEVKFGLDKKNNKRYAKEIQQIENKLGRILSNILDYAKIGKDKSFSETLDFIDNLQSIYTKQKSNLYLIDEGKKLLNDIERFKKDYVRIMSERNTLINSIRDSTISMQKKIFTQSNRQNNIFIFSEMVALSILKDSLENNLTNIEKLENSFFDKLKNDIDRINQLGIVQNEIKGKFDGFEGSVKKIYNRKNDVDEVLKKLNLIHDNIEKIDSLVVESIQNKEDLKSRIEESIEIGLADSNYSGQSVRKSDIIINDDFTRARILYRNYKGSLRHMPALDPAEKLGIFRIRYIPFPIARLPDSTKMQLIPFSGQGASVVFEIGLAFGNAIVPGDDFVVPSFSWERLGFAFAITEKLFSKDAQLIGLALTYDFNSYASIGIGGNFAQEQIGGYFSLGINKKAFEQVVSALGGIFK